VSEQPEEEKNLSFRVERYQDINNPSLWGSGFRLVQACNALAQIKSISDRIMGDLRSIDWPWARGVFDTSNNEDLAWEVPYDPAIVSDEDMRKASYVASEILHYVRSSLDHLVYNVSWADRGSRQDDTQFPIFDSATSWTPRMIQRRLGGMSQRHAAWIESVQPFSGVEWTRILRDLSNADKHRFNVKVSPTVQFDLDTGTIHPDPEDADRQRAAIKNVTLHFLLPEVDQHGGDIAKVFDAMFVGAGELINKFLVEAGVTPIQITLPGQA
jgi:hypothetical protein